MDKKIKILRIIARLNIGGPAIHTILLTEGLSKGRFETILVTGSSEETEGDMSYLAQEKGLHPVVIVELSRSLNLRNDFIAFRKLFRLIKREKPDIIHTHTAKAGTLGRLAAILAKLSFQLSAFSFQPKLIHTFHGHVLHSYFGKIKSTLFIWIERFLALFTDRIIAVSENLRTELIGFKIAGPKKIITVPLGLELEKFLQIERNGSEIKDYKSVGIIGRLVPVKNHKMFLDSVKKLKDTLGSKQRVKFLIVGDGPLRQQLRDYSRVLKVEQDVSFTGWINDLKKIYSQLDIVVLTSLNEGTPVALIEAQAAGCACVATDVGGVRDVVEQGKSGFLVPCGNVAKLIQAITDLFNNPILLQEMGKYGRNKVRDKFSKDRLFKDMEAVYEQEIHN